ncbi:MAG: hypothetical protein AB8B55_09890 [Mariniblastus sp.]
MLFSNDEIAAFINENFEPCWKSVRKVPTVSIDFGNGVKLKRTLHGNIAAYVCDSKGSVIDVLPGVYDPVAYKKQLEDLKLVSEYVSVHGVILESKWLGYHKTRVSTIGSGEEFEVKRMPVGRATNSGVEQSLEIVLNPEKRQGTEQEARGGRAGRGTGQGGDAEAVNRDSIKRQSGVEEFQNGKTLAKKLTLNDRLAIDTRINETERRVQIHNYILQNGMTTPDGMSKWLYREVLHADLDDPFMGLGEILFENYPFEKEDQANN